MLQVYEGTKPYIFISYAHRDTPLVLPMIQGLQHRGFRVWYDSGIEVGTEWPATIAQHLQNCGCVILFLSKQSASSFNCQQELTFALNARKNILVAYLEDLQLPPGMELQLCTLHAIFYSRFPDRNAFLDELCRSKMLAPCREDDPQTVPPMPPEDAVHLLHTGLRHYRGEGVPVNLSLAADCFRKAAELGSPEGQYYMGVCFHSGEGVPQNFRKAAEYFLQAAEQGHTGAMNNLYFLYRDGTGVERDPEKGVRWLRKAADAGDSTAQYNLGMWYQLSHDPENAVKWYTLAAQQGQKDAQYWLGSCYMAGNGLKKDLDQALVWLRAAAGQGHEEAQKAIDLCQRQRSVDGFVQLLGDLFRKN